MAVTIRSALQPGGIGALSRLRAGRAALLATIGVSAAGIALPVVELRRARRTAEPTTSELVLDGHIGHDGSGEALEMVWLGDSLAAGVGAGEPDGSLPRQVAALLGCPVSLTVLARSGARIADVAHDQLPRLAELAHPPDLILVSVGANDVAGRTRRRSFTTDYTQVLDTTAASGAEVIVLGIPDMSSALVLAQPLRSLAGLHARIVDRWVRATVAAHAENVSYVDITAHEKVPRRRLSEYLSIDRYHPNAEGYGVWASLVANRIDALLAGEATG